MRYHVETRTEIFTVEKIKDYKWGIYNSNGECLRTCKTKKECIERIKEQRV